MARPEFLIPLARAGDTRARAMLLRDSEWLVRRAAGRHAHVISVETADLLQVGRRAVDSAIDRWAPERCEWHPFVVVEIQKAMLTAVTPRSHWARARMDGRIDSIELLEGVLPAEAEEHEDLVRLPPAPGDVLEHVLWREELRELVAALRRLTPAERSIVRKYPRTERAAALRETVRKLVEGAPPTTRGRPPPSVYQRAVKAVWRADNKERIRESQQAYRESNRVELRRRNRSYMRRKERRLAP